MVHHHSEDIHIDNLGRQTRTPQKVVDDTETLSQSHQGAVCVHGSLTIACGVVHNGLLRVQPDGEVVVRGVHNGSLHVASGALVIVHGQNNGSVTVDAGGRVEVSSAGRLAGSLTVAGRVENSGTRGGSVAEIGSGEIVDLPGGRVKQPVRRFGGSVYEW